MALSTPDVVHELNHYQILSLSPPNQTGRDVTAQDIKIAYRRSLLHHHPDKSKSTAPKATNLDPPKPTIDAITLAYKVLSDTTSRSDYDRFLRLQGPNSNNAALANPHPGLETVDLDDLDYDEMKQVWYCSCRCGNEKGFLLIEQELEKEAEQGEVITGCRGCSLWLRVIFEVADCGQK
ncbi:hypothetical protein MMC08_004673 [Hypocenomyce scalaris]|nr:hypothetical protein [Hypocenomyce scalaris]